MWEWVFRQQGSVAFLIPQQEINDWDRPSQEGSNLLTVCDISLDIWQHTSHTCTHMHTRTHTHTEAHTRTHEMLLSRVTTYSNWSNLISGFTTCRQAAVAGWSCTSLYHPVQAHTNAQTFYLPTGRADKDKSPFQTVQMFPNSGLGKVQTTL